MLMMHTQYSTNPEQTLNLNDGGGFADTPGASAARSTSPGVDEQPLRRHGRGVTRATPWET
jgi:hypothetical protein